MSTAPLRVGVIGLGKMGLLHAGLANSLPGSTLTAVADSAPGILGPFQRLKPNVRVYEDFERLLAAETLDAVFIAAPTHLHIRAATACATKRIAFLVEKPLASRGSDCAPLIDALNRVTVTNAVGYMARHIATFAKAKDIVESGVLGQLIHLQASMYVAQLFGEGRGWRYDASLSGGGVLITQNSHLIDLLLWFFGPVKRVSGHVKNWYSKTVDDFAHAYLEFQSGLSGYIDCSWSIRHHRTVDLSINVHGEHGTLRVTDDEVELFLDQARDGYAGGWTLFRKPDLFKGVSLDVGGAEYTLQDEQFLAAVSAGAGVASDVASAFRVQRTIDAIYESSASGSAVYVE